MKLFYSSTSPFVRKVLVLAMETDIADRIQTIPQTVSPVAANDQVSNANPLGKIPALSLDDGTTLFDSRVICQYLDTQHEQQPAYPVEGLERFQELTREATADGLIDACILVRYEQALRPESLRWDDWIEGQSKKVKRALAALERMIGNRSGHETHVSIGDIATGCAVAYVDLRMPDMGWREECPALALWFEHFGARPSMQATAPQG